MQILPLGHLHLPALTVMLACGPQVSWSPDSTQLLSASGDKTAKLWDVGTAAAVTTFTLGSNVLDQQLGCLWQKDHLLSLSLSGYINYLDKNNPSKPLQVIKVSEAPYLMRGEGGGWRLAQESTPEAVERGYFSLPGKSCLAATEIFSAWRPEC